jgi:RNA polymerase sigma factor (sigma-70 family)
MIMDASSSHEERDTLQEDVSLESEFATFYRSHVNQLVAFLMVQGFSREAASDAAQEAMVSLFQNWSRVENPRAWVFKVASRTVFKQLTEHRELLVGDVPDAAVDDHATDRSDPSEIQTLLAALPPRQRQVMAFVLSGFRANEVATHLHIGEDTVRQHLMHARRTLRTQIGQQRQDS